MTINRYPFSSVYPIDKAAVQAIAENMRTYGYDPTFPILLKNGEIVDGFHRHEAALLAEVEPTFQDVPSDWDDNDILRYVVRANGDRRHLNNGQRAAAAVLIKRKLGDAIESAHEIAKTSGVRDICGQPFHGDGLRNIGGGYNRRNYPAGSP